MASARNYWTTDDLWKNWRYWSEQEAMRRRFSQPWDVDHRQKVNVACQNAKASWDKLCDRRSGLRDPDRLSRLAVEGCP